MINRTRLVGAALAVPLGLFAYSPLHAAAAPPHRAATATPPPSS